MCKRCDRVAADLKTAPDVPAYESYHAMQATVEDMVQRERGIIIKLIRFAADTGMTTDELVKAIEDGLEVQDDDAPVELPTVQGGNQ